MCQPPPWLLSSKWVWPLEVQIKLPRPSVTGSTLRDFRHQAHQTILKNTLFKYTPLWKCKSNYLCYSYSAIEVSTLSHFRLKTHQTILKNIHTFKIQFSDIHFVGSANHITPAALSHNWQKLILNIGHVMHNFSILKYKTSLAVWNWWLQYTRCQKFLSALKGSSTKKISIA